MAKPNQASDSQPTAAESTEVDAPVVHVVTESFVIDVNGTSVAYRKGEPVEADDPLIKKMPRHFTPMVFPHPIKRRALSTPEVRS